jgi:hypothetical protein
MSKIAALIGLIVLFIGVFACLLLCTPMIVTLLCWFFNLGSTL